MNNKESHKLKAQVAYAFAKIVSHTWNCQLCIVGKIKITLPKNQRCTSIYYFPRTSEE